MNVLANFMLLATTILKQSQLRRWNLISSECRPELKKYLQSGLRISVAKNFWIIYSIIIKLTSISEAVKSVGTSPSSSIKVHGPTIRSIGSLKAEYSSFERTIKRLVFLEVNTFLLLEVRCCFLSLLSSSLLEVSTTFRRFSPKILGMQDST